MKQSSKGTWQHRFAIRAFTVALTILVFWILGFLVQDIRSIKGPDYNEIEKKHLRQELVDQRDALNEQISELSHRIDNLQQKQRLVGDSSRNLQQTINQLLELQKIGLEKSIPFSEKEQENFTSSMNLFLENQRKYQELSQTISDMLEQKQEVVDRKTSTEQEIERQRKPAREEYNTLRQRHRIKLAGLQLLILLPILVLSVVIVIKKRSSIYFPLYLGFGSASLIKVVLVVHEYFPTRYFKYILIGGLLAVVIRLLIFFIRAIAFPKTEWMVKQNRDAYEHFLCPVCEYPIRTGPRRFLFWTRRTVKKSLPAGIPLTADEKYTCPCCETELFEECPACHDVRHAMLPACSHCGAHKEIG